MALTTTLDCVSIRRGCRLVDRCPVLKRAFRPVRGVRTQVGMLVCLGSAGSRLRYPKGLDVRAYAKK